MEKCTTSPHPSGPCDALGSSCTSCVEKVLKILGRNQGITAAFPGLVTAFQQGSHRCKSCSEQSDKRCQATYINLSLRYFFPLFKDVLPISVLPILHSCGFLLKDLQKWFDRTTLSLIPGIPSEFLEGLRLRIIEDSFLTFSAFKLRALCSRSLAQHACQH